MNGAASELYVDTTPHPVLRLPTREQAQALGPEKVCELLERRRALISAEREDPYRHGYYLSCWEDADKLLADLLLLCIFGGNGSGKTFFLARKGMQTMIDNPGAKVLWLHESESSSILVHQAAVYRYLPKEWKNLSTKRSRVRNINYSVANGFSDNRFVLPNGSIGVFGTYKQAIGDYEGTGWTLICADENLPLNWLKTLLIRLPRCGGKFLWGYTPIHGVTKAIQHVVEGAVTEESLPAPLLPSNKRHVEDCPPGHMPYVQRCVWDSMRIIYFFSSMNPYGNYEDLMRVLSRMSAIEVERRAYGWARNTLKICFPKFSAVHIVAPERIPKKEVMTLRHYADPAGARNMFQIWVGTDKDNRRYVYREWPDAGSYGEWAVSSEETNRWDGTPGPAQPTLGYGVIDYKRIILEAEGHRRLPDGSWEMCGETIFERYMDPRSGAARTITEEDGGSSIMDLMAEEQRDKDGAVIGPSLYFEQAPGLIEDQGIIVIGDMLSYNSEEKLCPIFNEPALYVSSDCVQTIWALRNYTRHDGEKAACKDPIDCLRYMATGPNEFADPEMMKTRGGGSY
jgi:hypothetical protein